MSALIRAQLSVQSAQVQPGARAEVMLTVQNFSEIVDRYKITVEGIDPSWVTISQEEVALFPKEQDQVLLTVHPPAGAEARAGHEEIQIQVISQDNPSERTTVPLGLEVLPLPALEVVLRPQRQSGMTEGAFRVHLSNQGNTDLTVEFETVDPEEALIYAFSPSPVVVPAGQEHVAHLKVQAKSPLSQEQPKTYSFTITARPQESAKLASQVRGEWVQTPPDFDVTLSPQRQSTTREGQFGIRVRNRGNAELTVQLEAGDSEQRCLYLLDPQQVVVPAAQERQASLRLRPKTALPGGQAHVYPFLVTARLAAAPVLARQVRGEWEQVPPTFEVALQPTKQAGPTEGLFRVQLRNPGNSDLTLQLEANDPQGDGLYTFESSRILVPAGQEHGVQLRIRRATPASAGAGRVIPFTVTARLVEAPSLARQVQGEWNQTSTAPPIPAAPSTAPAKAPRFWVTVLFLLFGEGLALVASFLVASALDASVEIWILLWLIGIIPVAFVAGKIWRGERLGSFLVMMLVGQAITIPVVFFIANQIDLSAKEDPGFTPLLVAIIVWLVGLAVTISLARRVSRPQE